MIFEKEFNEACLCVCVCNEEFPSWTGEREGEREDGTEERREKLPFPLPRVEGGSCPEASACFPPVCGEGRGGGGGGEGGG